MATLIKTHQYPSSSLNEIMAVLGTTKATLWPFLESTGVVIGAVGAGPRLIPSETAAAAEALEDDFAPVKFASGLHSYYFSNLEDQHLAVGADNANFHFDGDAAFSVGAWIQPQDITTVGLMALYDSAGAAEEWAWRLDGSSKLELELHDASASAKEVGASDTALVQGQWAFVVSAYDGTAATPEILHYINGAVDGDGATTETGAYVGMEDKSTPLTIGCTGVTALPTEEYTGRIALPFITGKQLTAANILLLYNLTRPLVGIIS
jgi:hypothetical protein